MKETVSILRRKPANVVLFEAMIDVIGDDGDDGDVAKRFGIDPNGDATTATVEVQVNGIPVSFETALSAAMDRMMASYEEDVKKAALELIKERPLLMNLCNALDDAEWHIKEALDKVEAGPKLLAIVKQLTLATDDGDDQAKGCAYLDVRNVIRFKGSFLELIERARAVVKQLEGK